MYLFFVVPSSFQLFIKHKDPRWREGLFLFCFSLWLAELIGKSKLRKAAWLTGLQLSDANGCPESCWDRPFEIVYKGLPTRRWVSMSMLTCVHAEAKQRWDLPGFGLWYYNSSVRSSRCQGLKGQSFDKTIGQRKFVYTCLLGSK